MSAASNRPALIPAVSYQDPKAALDWLGKAFGFEIEMVIEDEQGNPVHSEMRYGDGLVMIGSEWNADTKSPASIGRKCTQTVHVHMSEDIDAHCARAEKAGAEILMRPETQFYGDRTYRARDPEGHIWTFGQTVQVMSPEEWDKASGLRTRMK
ncbi:MAG: VOC family protein [Alphaproteobacteria bacterium]|nr:VOC family protein [Alphaproteobacteria bacterium]